MKRISYIAIAVTALLSTGCNTLPYSENPSETKQSKAQAIQDESAKANALFDQIFDEGVMRSPVYQTYLGIKQDYGKWDDMSDANALIELEHTKNNLKRIQQLNLDALDDNTKVSYDLLVQSLQSDIDDYQWRLHSYPVNQMYGTHSMVPALLINQHRITNVDDALAYISRLNGVKPMFAQLQKNLEARAAKGIIIPKFVFPHVIDSSQNILKGAPFSAGKDSTLLADFSRKLKALKLPKAQHDGLLRDATLALVTSVKPAYESLTAYLEDLNTRADNRDGAWKFEDGEAFYNNALARTTTTNLTANEIHNIGLEEVKRIHNEMRVIKDKVGFEGDLQAFMAFMKSDPQFYLPDTDEGKQKYLADAVAMIDNMKSRLDELFIVKPKAELYVKRVESFREKAAGKAFYQQPSADGSRPGIYYANLYDMSAMPTYQMEALAYHEGLPGHHMQIAISQELQGLPKFRKFGRYTAYTEGWGLYSELVPKEMGLYQDPYSDFGRLAMELWRACRLVVDTGIHAMRWDRQRGIDYYVNNTPNSTSDAVKMVERHIVMPSQATAYKIGMLKIVELRDNARQVLGDKFDIREFHDVVLKNGPVPLNVLENYVNQWVASKQV